MDGVFIRGWLKTGASFTFNELLLNLIERLRVNLDLRARKVFIKQ